MAYLDWRQPSIVGNQQMIAHAETRFSPRLSNRRIIAEPTMLAAGDKGLRMLDIQISVLKLTG